MSKYIGLLGGMGYRSTMLAYERLQQLYAERMGEEHTCPVVLLSVDFATINALLPNNIEAAAALLSSSVEQLDRIDGVCCNLLINNTLHKSLDVIVQQKAKGLKTNYGHIGVLLKQTLQKQQPENVLLIGTKYTMSDPYFKAFVPETTQLLIASKPLTEQIDKLRKAYYHAANVEMAQSVYENIQAEFPNLDTLVLTCTEHSLAFKDIQPTETIVDTMQLQCEYAIDQLINT